MGKKLQDSEEEEMPSRNDSDCSNSSNRRKSLFSCCFKFSRRKKQEDVVDYDPEAYDYIVEKLVVKRVPLAFFAISKDVSDREGTDLGEGTSGSPQSPMKEMKSVYPVALESNESQVYRTKDDNHSPGSTTGPGRNLRFSKDAIAAKENKIRPRSTDYDACAEHKIRIPELLSRLSAFHPDLKESERPPKDPCPLNLPKNEGSTEKITGGTPIKEFDGRGKESQQTIETFSRISGSSVVDRVPTRERSKVTYAPVESQELDSNLHLHSKSGSTIPVPYESIKGNDHNNLKLTENGKFVISPVQIEHICRNSKVFYKKEIDITDWPNVENCNPENSDEKSQRNNIILCTQDEADESETNSTDASNAVLRWKIIIKHCGNKE